MVRHLSLSTLRQRFRAPLTHSIFIKSTQPKQEVIPIIKHDEPILVNNVLTESVRKEDSMISSFYIETHIARFKPQNQTSSCILQMGFCCQKPNAKLLAVNHTTQLFDCCKERCSRKLIKVSIGNWS